MHPFLASMLKTVEKYRMFRPGEKILVGASGGPDSVSLLHGLRTCFGDRLNLVAVHIHHGLRGEEADSDASWVREFCESLGVECLTRNIEPDGWSAPPQESVQMRARKLRYGIFETLVRERAADRLALGHTADDQAETVLLNLIRGAGRPGLAGIPPVRPIARAGGATVIRPLIETSRELILRCLREEQISYREDSSNQSDRYLRNRIRRHLIPELASYNPGIRDALGRTAEILRAEESWMESEETRALSSITLPPDKEGFSVSIPRLLGLPLALQRRVTIRILRGAAFTAVGFDHVETLLAHVRDSARGGPGGERRICLPGGVAAILERETIRFLPEDATAPPDIERMRSGWGLPVPGMTELAPWGIRMETALSSSGEDPSPPPLPSSIHEAHLDLDLTGTALSVRSRRPGDRFRPLGLGGTKKIQDFLVDARVPKRRRDHVPLLVTETGEIAWIIGHRIDDRFKIRAGTKRVLRLKATPIDCPEEPAAEN